MYFEIFPIEIMGQYSPMERNTPFPKKENMNPNSNTIKRNDLLNVAPIISMLLRETYVNIVALP